MTPQKIDILLSTYNGEQYLDPQIQSLLDQTDTDWRLVIRDDGSSDNTMLMLSKWTTRDSRILLIEDNLGNLGPAQSFISLLSQVEGDIFMFCDQDDVWKPEKLAIFRAEMEKGDPKIPLLCYSDATVVDEDLKVIDKSFFSQQRFSLPEDAELAPQLLHNVVVGCTAAGNRSLLDLVLACPEELLGKVIMHDWWLADLALLAGELCLIEEPLIYYRIHQNNVIGAQSSSISTALKQKSKLRKAQNHLVKCQGQAEIIAAMMGNEITDRNKKLLDLMINNNKKHSLFSLIKCFISGIRMSTIIRNFGLIAAVMTLQRK